MQRILMLGASDAQTVAIERAIEIGLTVFTADNRPDNPGHRLAHAAYNVSTTDSGGILRLAEELGVNGVLSYASDPGALTAAIVSEALGLAGDPKAAVEVAQDKLKFRTQQSRLKHPHPDFADADDASSLEKLYRNAHEGLVVKPTDRCGSAGLHIFDHRPDRASLNQAIDAARNVSFCKKVIVEARVQRTGLQFGGDYIFHQGRLCFASHADQYQFRTATTEAGIGNLVPSGHSEKVLSEATEQVVQLVETLGLGTGIYNTDVIVSEDQVYVLDFGARLGGNMLGEVHRLATGVDYTLAAIQLALGETPQITRSDAEMNAGHLVVHSDRHGTLQEINFSETLRDLMAIDLISKQKGAPVQPYASTSDRLGILVLQSPNREKLIEVYQNPIPHFGLVLDNP